MKILVLGCKGFVGSVFSRLAMLRGHEVWGIDDESRGENSIEFLGGRYKKHDLLGGILEAHREPVDVVAAFAARTGDLALPLDELMALNFTMLQRMHSDAIELGAKCFLWPTTSLALEVKESNYVISKEAGLQWLRDMDSAATCLRFFNLCGSFHGLSEKRSHEVHILFRLIESIVTKKPFIVNGSDYETSDGSPSRDMTNVIDACEAMLRLASLKVRGMKMPPPHTDGCHWFGTGQLTTVYNAINAVERYTGQKINWQNGPRRSYDCAALHVDPVQRDQFAELCGGMLTPARVSIREEIDGLLPWVQAKYNV